MPTLKDWLKRGKKRPKQKKRIRPMSKKRAAENAIYLKRRTAFLKARPYCEACRNLNIDISEKSSEVHHVFGRGKYFLDVMTWLAVCRPCHNWIHSHPAEARKLGLLAP